MRTTKTFKNATLRTVNNGYIELDYNGKTVCFHDASVVSVNNGIITIKVDWKPEKGELIKVTGSGIDSYSIFDHMDECLMRTFGYKRIIGTANKLQNDFWLIGSATKISPVTPEEQQAFDDFCKTQGKIWNKEKLQWETYKWEPKQCEKYYFIDTLGEVSCTTNNTLQLDPARIKYGNCFPTKEQAKKVAEKLEEFFKSL